MANNEQSDKELNEYLNGDSDVSKTYRALNTAEPATHVDKKILAAAKGALVDNKQQTHREPYKSTWLRPVSIAAMITLSVSLVVTMQQESGQPLISEPGLNIESSNSAVLSEESILLQTDIADDMLMLDESEKKQSDDARVVVPSALNVGEGNHTESKKSVMKDETTTTSPTKRSLLKQKPRSIESEKRVFSKEQLLQSDPVEVEFDAVMELKKDLQRTLQEEELLEIKDLLLEGDVEEAKDLYQQFLRKYPGYSNSAIHEIIGEELLGLIK
ncbi:MAG: hypothetical protein DHS20C09_18620 [marine bacterium B5-7]|nr:MAG: hypothetical protein DHS20C09_18620 [marine bacterium B5-7]